MFSDSLMAIMFMQVLCFTGAMVMFLFIIRSLAAQTAAMRDAQRKQQEALADIERQMMDMAFHLRGMSAGESARTGTLEQAGDLGGLLDAVSPGSSSRINEDLSAHREDLPGTGASTASLDIGRDTDMPFDSGFPADAPARSPHENTLPDLNLPFAGRSSQSGVDSRNAARHGTLNLRLDG